jgi:hypothetical protein
MVTARLSLSLSFSLSPILWLDAEASMPHGSRATVGGSPGSWVTAQPHWLLTSAVHTGGPTRETMGFGSGSGVSPADVTVSTMEVVPALGGRKRFRL